MADSIMDEDSIFDDYGSDGFSPVAAPVSYAFLVLHRLLSNAIRQCANGNASCDLSGSVNVCLDWSTSVIRFR